MSDDELSDLIIEIFKGVTVTECSFGNLYFKHFDNLNSRDIFSNKPKFIKEAISKGLETESESLKRIIEDCFWTNEEEKDLQEKEKFVSRIKDGLKKIKIPSKREQHKKYIKLEEDKVLKKRNERKSLIGLTAEIFAENKINKLFFDSVTFIDEKLTIPALKEIGYDEIEKEREIYSKQQEFFKKFDDVNISKAALCPFYSPYLAFAEDPFAIYGKSLIDLTTFQMRLTSYSRTFLNIFKNSQKTIPEYVMKDPELLVEFWEAQREGSNKKPSRATEGSGGTTHFGANQQDLQNIAESDEDVVSLSKEIKNKGGKLTMEQMMKLHGV
jgi:hypothetical protein